MKTTSILRFIYEEEATTAVEYAILLGVIMIAIIKACQILGGEMNAIFTESHTAMDDVINN